MSTWIQYLVTEEEKPHFERIKTALDSRVIFFFSSKSTRLLPFNWRRYLNFICRCVHGVPKWGKYFSALSDQNRMRKLAFQCVHLLMSFVDSSSDRFYLFDHFYHFLESRTYDQWYIFSSNDQVPWRKKKKKTLKIEGASEPWRNDIHPMNALIVVGTSFDGWKLWNCF